MNERARETFREWIRKYSIRIAEPGQEFELTSGQKSNVYCDLKKTLFRADVLDLLGLGLHSKANEHFEDITTFAGVELGGCHLASVAASHHFGRDVIYVRKEAKGHGTKNLIEGPDKLGSDRVVLLEDVTTTAGSAVRALQALREADYNVLGIITVVDRRNAWTEVPPPATVEGAPIFSLFRIEELVPPRGLYF